MQCYVPKAKKHRRRFLTFTAIVLLLVVGVLFFMAYYINPIIVAISEARVKSYTVRAVNDAIQTVFRSSNIYDDLIEILYDNNGDISAIQTKSAAINFLSKELVREALNNVEDMGANGFGIPIGSFTGMPILVGRGPEVIIRLIPIGSVHSNFISQFVAAGINQTNHRIYLNMETRVSLILPVVHRTITSVANVLICESIIIGKVPHVYFSSNNLTEMLNLVPH
ncbi:MAG: sporulation protein YunB [Firmicutes bacterium]|nr:sporulation protein YunB [Bacillota bacterium]